MFSSRAILKLTVMLLAAMAVIGQLQSRNPAVHFAQQLNSGQEAKYVEGDSSFRIIAVVAANIPSKDSNNEKRHKRLIISKFFQPAPLGSFVRRYCLLEFVTLYSSPYIPQKAATVHALRGPPFC